MKRILLVVCLVATMAVMGCATYGKEFDESLVRELVVGKSTKAEAIALFGPSRNVTVTNYNDEYRELMMWSHGRATAFAISSRGRALILTFNKEGILTGYNLSNIESGL